MVEDWMIAARQHPVNSSKRDWKQLYNRPVQGIFFPVQLFILLLLSFSFPTIISSGINLKILGIANFTMTTRMKRERITRRKPSEVSPRPSAVLEKKIEI